MQGFGIVSHDAPNHEESASASGASVSGTSSPTKSNMQTLEQMANTINARNPGSDHQDFAAKKPLAFGHMPTNARENVDGGGYKRGDLSSGSIYQSHKKLFKAAEEAGMNQRVETGAMLKKLAQSTGLSVDSNAGRGPGGGQKKTKPGTIDSHEPIRMVTTNRAHEIATLADRSRYVDMCTEFLDLIRAQEFAELLNHLDTFQLVANVVPPAEDQNGLGGGPAKMHTYFTESRLNYNDEKGVCTYDDPIFEIVNFVDPRNGFTPLIWSVMHDNDQICDFLLTCKADPCVQHPLKKCVLWRRFRCAEVLIRHGANRLQRDENGKIPYDYVFAKSKDNDDDMERLEARIARLQKQGGAAPIGVDKLLENDMLFLTELVKPTHSDVLFLERRKKEQSLTGVSLWAGSLEEFQFRQDLRIPPNYFVITSDTSVLLTNTNGKSIRAYPGTIWQQKGIESVPGEPLCFWVHLTNGLQPNSLISNCVSGWVLWDRRRWQAEANRLGLTPGLMSRTVEKETATSMVKTSLQIAQDADAWEKMPSIAPIQVFDSSNRKLCQIKSTVPLKARSGPTLSDNCKLSSPVYKMGESVLMNTQVVLDGGWIFYQIKKRHYGQIEEQAANGWISARARNYVTTVLKD